MKQQAAVKHRFVTDMYSQRSPVGVGPQEVDELIGEGVRAIEKALKMPVWVLAEDSRSIPGGMCSQLDEFAFMMFNFGRKKHIPKGRRLAVILNSNGGLPEPTYRIARLLRKHCGGFTAIIPDHAMSAATLLTLGADEIYVAETAQLGPLDIQKWDSERERWKSVLEGVQIFEKTSAEAHKIIQSTFDLLKKNTQKRISTILPLVLDFTASLMRPMYERLDPYDFIREYRDLAIARDYARRLLEVNYPDGTAKSIADRLVSGYQTHSFVIDRAEAMDIGLKIMEQRDDVEQACQSLIVGLWKHGMIGPVRKEVVNEPSSSQPQDETAQGE